MRNEKRANKIHGILLMALFAMASVQISEFSFIQALKLSPLIIGVIVGMVYANTLRSHLPETWVPGILFSGKTILRIAIAFFGFRLTLTDVVAVGWSGVLVDVFIIISVILIGLLFGRLLGLDRDTSMLVSSGSAICGAAAVLATEPVLESKPYKTVVAVSTVVIFGTLSMFLYPILYRSGVFSFMNDHQVGIYTGSTLHEVAHVAGAGQAMGDAIANVATITKMIRVIMLAPFLILLGVFAKKGKSNAEQKNGSKITIPWFAVWFLVLIGVNTLLSVIAGNNGFADEYRNVNNFIANLDTFALTIAMTAIGAEASFEKFKKAGAKPFILALILYVWLIFAGAGATYIVCGM